jgi:hypothetical protein
MEKAEVGIQKSEYSIRRVSRWQAGKQNREGEK